MPDSDKEEKKQDVLLDKHQTDSEKTDAEPQPAPPGNTKPGSAPKRPLSNDMDFLLDIPLEISVELGRTKMLINDLLHLGQGSVIELSKLAGETLEIFANQKLVARGEVVVVNEKYGIRLSEIISPSERIKRLK
ncbi:MAG: flagellar motor switch protein FliN [Desulfobacterales bacterium]|jgi:flagellar motor switch protein FliN/FliY